jgi:hypothetical protein
LKNPSIPLCTGFIAFIAKGNFYFTNKNILSSKGKMTKFDFGGLFKELYAVLCCVIFNFILGTILISRLNNSI